jgi:hypothetical protein
MLDRVRGKIFLPGKPGSVDCERYKSTIPNPSSRFENRAPAL